MELKSKRLLLRELTWDDLEKIHELESIFQVNEFNTIGNPKNIEETRQNITPFIEAKEKSPQYKYGWSITTLENNEFIGMAGVNLSNDRFRIGEIFYKFLPNHWGKGYATEVSGKIIEFGFYTLKLHRIEASFATQNIRSRRVLEKCGMIKEGIARKILPIRGNWVDACLYSIIEDEYRKK
jgi:RimJ/RimL family protein N-acetyltransferase